MLNIRISINFQSRSVVRNSNKHNVAMMFTVYKNKKVLSQ